MKIYVLVQQADTSPLQMRLFAMPVCDLQQGSPRIMPFCISHGQFSEPVT